MSTETAPPSSGPCLPAPGPGPERRRSPPPPPNSCVVLKNLDYTISAVELEAVVGDIVGGRRGFAAVSLVEDRATKAFRGMAFVNFHTLDDAARHVAALGAMRVNGRRVYAEYRRMRPGEKERRPRKAEEEAPAGPALDKRASFFRAREKEQGATKFSREQASAKSEAKTGKERELEADFRRQLEEYRDAGAGGGGDDAGGDMCFDQDLSSFERRIVHVLCDELGLGHVSRAVDDGARRVLFVTRDEARIAEWEAETADARKAAAEKAQEKEAKGRGRRDNVQAGASFMAPGAPTERQLQGIKWFRPKCAQDGSGDGIVKPNIQVYVPPRQPTGPDGSVGFARRNPAGQRGAAAEDEGQTKAGVVSRSEGKLVEATDSEPAEGSSSSVLSNGVRKIALNPDVPAFQFPAHV